jgi:hypothetical protein
MSQRVPEWAKPDPGERVPVLVEKADEDSHATFNVPSRVAVTELRVPLIDFPEPPRTFEEAGPLRRFSPRKSWPEVGAIDAKLAKLDRQRAELGEKIAQLEQAIRDAARADMEAVAEWQLAGSTGGRPLATVLALEAELAQARSDVDACAVAEERILREKVEFVSKHRKRLNADAAKTRGLAVKRLQDAITEVEQARAEAVEALLSERWTREFPGDAANAGALRLELMKGGRISKALPDLRTITVATSVIEYQRDDANWLDAVLADEQQERELDPHEQPVWEDSDEGRKAVALANRCVAEGLKPRAVRQAEWMK